MNTPVHNWHRLHYTGLRGLEREARSERRYQLAMSLLLTLVLIGMLCLVQGCKARSAEEACSDYGGHYDPHTHLCHLPHHKRARP